MITLTYGSLVVSIKSPVFGNKESVEVRRIVRKTRGGDLTICRDLAWPKTIIVTYAFSYLKEIDYTRLMEFMSVSLGQIITLLDYEGRLWQGIIITPGNDFSETGIQDTGAGFQFQGVIIG